MSEFGWRAKEDTSLVYTESPSGQPESPGPKLLSIKVGVANLGVEGAGMAAVAVQPCGKCAHLRNCLVSGVHYAVEHMVPLCLVCITELFEAAREDPR